MGTRHRTPRLRFVMFPQRLAIGLVALLVTAPAARAATLDLTHVIGKHADNNGVTQVTLAPDPVQLLLDPSRAFMDAMTNSKAAADWWGKTVNTFNWTGSLAGTFAVDVYNAQHSSETTGGAEFLLHYTRGDGDPAAADLFWIQVVDSNVKNGGETAPYPDVYFSSYPDGGKLPPYFRPDETKLDPNPYAGAADIRSSKFTVGGKEYVYDMSFWDFPKREATAYWRGELFLATFDQPGKFIKIYDGVKWGFDVTPVPEPSTLLLLLAPALVLARRIRTWGA